MKVIAIQTSPNVDGLTASTAQSFLRGAGLAGHQTELINLNEYNVEKCKACNRGWGECKTNGMCVLKDDFQYIRGKIDTSDVLLFTTPVYWHDISESAKVFLDRWRRCETHYSFNRYTKKTAVGIVAAGGTGNGAARALYLLEDYIKRLGFQIFDLIMITQKNKSYKIIMLEIAGKNIFQ